MRPLASQISVSTNRAAGSSAAPGRDTSSPARSSPQTSNNSSPQAHDENDFSPFQVTHPTARDASPKGTHPAIQSSFRHGTTAKIASTNPLKLTDNNSKSSIGVGQIDVIDTQAGGVVAGKKQVNASSSAANPSSPLLASPKTPALLSLSEKKRLRTKNTLMTVSNKNEVADMGGMAALSPRKRDEDSFSSLNRERKEDDPSHFRFEQHNPAESQSSAMPPARVARPTSESGRSRGATPPRPGSQTRSRSNEGSNSVGGINMEGQPPHPTSLQPSQQRRPSQRSFSPNRIPRVPNKQTIAAAAADGTSSQTSSPRRFSKDQSCNSIGSTSRRSWAPPKPDPADHEQALFEQRLCEDAHGVAVRKISQNGRPNLRYVKCIYIESDLDTVGDSQYPSSTRSSVSSLARSFRKTGAPLAASNMDQQVSTRLRVLTWGKKKDVRLPLERFVCVRKGKTTERARRNTSPSSRILSLITSDPNHPSLDIEAPTRLDRDKFARAFARFLEVPLLGEDMSAQSVSPRTEQPTYKKTTAMSEPDLASTPKQAIAEAMRIKQQKRPSHNAPLPVVMAGLGGSVRNSRPQSIESLSSLKEELPLQNSGTSSSFHNASAVAINSQPNKANQNRQQVQIASLPASLRDSERSSTQAATASRPTDSQQEDRAGEDASQVSSLTGAGFDQEIVEELHQALTELRAELEESRAEAARAVKVAEQAIQSAENSNSNDWNSTVTHKAAEAAALAQKRSAEAMGKQRLAEERLEGERRTAAFWRRQAEAAEEEAGILQTRAAAAEVQRAAMAQELEAERRRTAAMMEALRGRSGCGSPAGDCLSLSTEMLFDTRDLFSAQSEVALLKEKLALESAARRKLLHEVQDLRGVVRVYCRPRKSPPGVKGILSVASQETLLLHPYDDEPPVSFKFDRVFSPDVEQREVYNEIEELCLSVLDGFNICLLAHGQRGSGKTYSMLGTVEYTRAHSGHFVDVEIKDQGVHMKTVQQLFSISEHRSERYQDTFTLEIVEVHNERLHDLLAGTAIGEDRGQVIMEDSRVLSHRRKRGMSEDGSATGLPQLSNSHSVSSKQGSTMTKLEIRTNHNGDTVVQGLLSVEIKSYEDVCDVWNQCLSQRASRLAEQGADLAEYEASSHVIATLTVVSVNSTTGMGSMGKIKFVDLAGADLVQRRGGDQKLCLTPDSSERGNSSNDWRYANRSLATLNDVINCRSQFMRSVPYRNSTLTHLLRDNLEADTKVLLLLCVSPHPKDLQETACALRFASGMRRVNVGKATKHSLCR